MYRPLDVPSQDTLGELPVEIRSHNDPGVCTVVAIGGDQDEVSLTWDEPGRSVVSAGIQRVRRD